MMRRNSVPLYISKGVTGGPSGPYREGPGVGYKIVLDIKQMTKERKKRKKVVGKGKIIVKKKKMEEREREKWTEKDGTRYRNALRHGQTMTMSIFCR